MRKRLSVLIRILMFVLLFVQTSTACFSQTNLDDNSSISRPRPLAMTQIPEFGNNTRNLISEIQLIVSEHEVDKGILPRLKDVLLVLDKKDSVLSDTLNIYRLDALNKEDRELSLLNQRIVQWKTTILKVKIQCQNKDSIASSIRQVWGLTLDSIRAAENRLAIKNRTKATPNDLKTEIVNFISDLNISQKRLHTYLENIQYIQTELTIAESQLGKVSNLINSRRTYLKQNIWMPEYPPIWQVKNDTVKVSKLERFKDLIFTDLNIIEAFINNNPTLPYYFAVFIIFIFGILLYLKPRAEILYSDFQEEFKDSIILLKYPLLSALVITWLCTLFFSFFPREFKDFVALVMFLPVMIILKKLNPNWKWYSVLFFSLSYFLFLTVKEFNYTLLAPRIALVIISLLTLSLFLFYKQKNTKEETKEDFWFGTLPFIINVFIVIEVISFFASIIGSIHLAQLLSYVTFGLIVVIYVLKTAVLLGRNFVFLVLMGPLIKYSYILKEDGLLVLAKMNKIFRLSGNVFLIYIILELLNLKESTWNVVTQIISFPLSVGEMSISLGKIIAFFLTIQISFWISSFIRYVLNKEVFPRTHLKQGVPNTILLMTKFTIVLLGILFAFSAAGIGMDKLAIAMGAIGVGIGFGLQNIISNFISGIILALERPITIGDLIDIPNVSGVVKDIGIRASTVRTWDGSDVIVPNAELISNKLTNWTFHDRLRRVKVEVRVPFDTNIESVSQLLLSAANEIPEVMKKPKPYLNFKGIGTSAMEISLYCWINDSDKIFSYGTTIRKAVYKALLDAGYKIPVPQQELKMTSSINNSSNTE